jgi:GxxExxY protein
MPPPIESTECPLTQPMTEQDITFFIIGCALRVHTALGPGLREKPYENALCIDLRENGFLFEQQRSFPIFYHDQLVGECLPDIVVNREVVIDVKSIDTIGDNEIAQMLNYLRITHCDTGLILNFNPKSLQIKRVFG